ncbi:MAG: protein translocase subunit SecDF [Pedosphaera sp.]|nr:protein translocase subunit SecDF [Pedosphaera sp.]
MNRNNLWKFVFVILVLVWSFYEMYPPVGRNLVTVFQDQVVPGRKDTNFTAIISRLQTLQKDRPDRTFANLVEATGTNNLSYYFPYYDVKGELDPNRAILYRLQREAAGKIHLGIDLQGGTAFVEEMDASRLEGATNSIIAQEGRDQALSQAAEVLRKRVDKLGVAEPVIQPQGNNRILIQLPGLSEADKNEAITNISKAAFLQFKLVHENSAELINQGLTEPGYEVLKEKDTAPNGTSTITPYLVKKKAELTGEYIKSAFMSRDPMGRPEINFTLNSKGAEKFAEITRDNVGRQLAIVLDGELQSAPRINGEIPGGSGVITGQFTDQRAQQLANVLENPLKAPLHLVSESSVDPTLGSDTVTSGVHSAVIGTILVALFMLVYYKFAGLVADIALITNIIILLGVMCSIGTTLTLPGIAGVVLTIGMAVDANVLIFERIREESAKGKSLRGALAAGYDRAFGTIFDSHVTTLISSIILIYMGTGPIKGFGVTLTIGVAASLFTALVVTRLIFDFLLLKGWLKSLPMLHIIRTTKLDFMKLAKPAFILSWTIILLGLGYGIFVRGDKMLGISFKGGDNVTLSFDKKVDPDKISAALTKDAGVFDPVVQYQKEIAGTGKETLSVTAESGKAPLVIETLKKDFPDAGFKAAGTETVGPTIGKEIRDTAILASLASLFGILVYVAFRYEFSFAVGAVVAVIHDVLMTIGCYCLTGLFTHHGREFNATMVAAVLTIIGFSINDTIVIFDRIREDLKMGVRGSFKEIINQALNQTLSRTIITSGTVFLATMSLYLFGGGAINDFAFTFLVGIITGTYSSIYIASALVLWWHKGVRPKTGSQVVVENTASTSRA